MATAIVRRYDRLYVAEAFLPELAGLVEDTDGCRRWARRREGVPR